MSATISSRDLHRRDKPRIHTAMDVPLSLTRRLAEDVAQHFAEHASGAAIFPDVDSIAEIAHSAFWTSLRREEGYTPTISLAHLPPGNEHPAIVFDDPISLSPDTLAKIAPAVERQGVHLAVWRVNGELLVWGTTGNLPPHCFVLEVIAPGLLVVKHSRGTSGTKFVNVAVLESDNIKLIDAKAVTVRDCPSLVSSLLDFDDHGQGCSANVLIQIAVSMREHRRGGLLLIVPPTTEWKESVLQPMPYTANPPFPELADLVADRRHDDRNWQDALRRAIAMIAGLTAVDGATVIDSEYRVLAFGAKIGRRPESPRIEQVLATEPVVGSTAKVLNVAQLGGTRHIAAAQFVHDQREAIGLVASQDGRFTVFAWSPCDDMVHAQRVEALLL